MSKKRQLFRQKLIKIAKIVIITLPPGCAVASSNLAAVSVARRASLGLPSAASSAAQSPVTKRARMSFNAPAFVSGKGQSCVAQQYFGNVPLQFQ
jgi:hypothetical protein